MDKEVSPIPVRLFGTHFHWQFVTRRYHWHSSALNQNLSCFLEHNDTFS